MELSAKSESGISEKIVYPIPQSLEIVINFDQDRAEAWHGQHFRRTGKYQMFDTVDIDFHDGWRYGQ